MEDIKEVGNIYMQDGWGEEEKEKRKRKKTRMEMGRGEEDG